eukprot:4535970-Amphidinium_carterae.1
MEVQLYSEAFQSRRVKIIRTASQSPCSLETAILTVSQPDHWFLGSFFCRREFQYVILQLVCVCGTIVSLLPVENDLSKIA